MYSVLYVDDENTLLEIAKLFLEKDKEFSVETLLSAEEALSLLKNSSFDAIISDYQMPGMDGIEFLKNLRSSGNTKPFIIFTGKGREEVVIDAINNGADFYLQKGGDPKSQFAELQHKIRQAVKRNRTEISLNESEARFRTLADASLSGIMIHDSGFIIDCNPQFAALFGYTREEIIGKNGFEFMLDGESVDVISRWVKEGAKGTIDITGIRKDGEKFYGETTSNSILWLGNMHSMVQMHDISARKVSERLLQTKNDELNAAYEQILASEEELRAQEVALRENEEKYRLLYENAGIGIGYYTPGGIVISFNRVAAANMGGYPEDYKGKSIFDLFPKDDADRYAARISKAIGSENSVVYEDMVPLPTGNRFFISSFTRIDGAEGKIAGIQIISQDITGRKQAEDALRESENRYRDLIDTSHDLIYSLSADGSFLYVSPAWTHVLGYPVSYASGHTFAEFTHPDDLAACYAFLKKVLETGERQEGVEYRVRRADGQWLWHTSSATPIRDASGAVSSFTGVAHDITRRKLAVEALRMSEQKLNSILNNITDVVWSLSWPDMKVDYISPSVEQVYGRSVQEFFDKPSLWAEIVHPDDRHITNKVLDDLQKCGSAVRVCRIVRPDGSIAWIQDRSKFIYDEHGNPVRAEGITSDITERKRVQDALVENESFNRGLVENLPAYIAVCDMDGTLLYVNSASARTLGYDAETLIGTHVLSYIAEEYHEIVIAKMTFRKEGGEASPYEIEIITRNGSRRSVIVKATPIKYQNNPATLLLLIDITDRKRAEEALILANKKLTLLSSITRHDINNQLMVLIGYLTILKTKQTDPSLNDYFVKVSNAAQRITSMIEFTREYENIGINAPAWQDCRTLIDTAAKQAPLGKIVVKNDLPTGAELFADPLIVKVFYNLMDNAARYGGKITTIRFSVEEQNGSRLIVCDDDGEGVAAVEKERIFDRGFGKNTGLGLALSREILYITAITIRETGEPGKGARFEMGVPKGAYRLTDEQKENT